MAIIRLEYTSLSEFIRLIAQGDKQRGFKVVHNLEET